tara:strand:- start:379 stop:936 length:558 start_codon:yes stop_codon:yes gene_type:complete
MSKTSNSKIFEITHEVESGNLEPDFVFFRKEQNFTVTKKIIILICGSGLIGFWILAAVLSGNVVVLIGTFPLAILGALMIFGILRLKSPLSDEVHVVISQVYISSINILLDYEFQNNEVVNCKTIPITKDSYIKYAILYGNNRTNHKYKLFTGKEKMTLRGEPHDRNNEFAKKYNIEIIQTKGNF